MNPMPEKLGREVTRQELNARQGEEELRRQWVRAAGPRNRQTSARAAADQEDREGERF